MVWEEAGGEKKERGGAEGEACDFPEGTPTPKEAPTYYFGPVQKVVYQQNSV